MSLTDSCISIQLVLSDGLMRVDPEFDESSCLCGLSKDILDKLESILRLSLETPTCPSKVNGSQREDSGPNAQEEQNHDNEEEKGTSPDSSEDKPAKLDSGEESGDDPEVDNSQLLDNRDVDPPEEKPPNDEDQQEAKPEANLDQEPEPSKNTAKNPPPESDEDKSEEKPAWQISSTHTSTSATYSSKPKHPTKPVPSEDHESEQSKNIAKDPPAESSHETTDEDEERDQMIHFLASEIHRLETMLLASKSGGSKKPTNPQVSTSSSDESAPSSTTAGKEPKTDQPGAGKDGINTGKLTITISSENFNTDLLSGLAGYNPLSNHLSLDKLNQSQHVKPEEMTNALESTIPNVVSNIFSNIQNLTDQAGRNPYSGKVDSSLTSIDGSSVNVAGSTSDEITAEGEKLFLAWVEHQLANLHLTAAMTSYLRKSAVNLFRQIARQYVERVAKMGGSLEDNVRRATQTALSITQNLTACLMKNYVTYAGGLMQIIGEQVSRVGKHLDSTGDSISHMSLNPFDFVSDVIDSLPNPSDYSKYFRAFGKQLLGDLSANHEQQSNPAHESEQKQSSLIRKTMGALSKTMGWLG